VEEIGGRMIFNKDNLTKFKVATKVQFKESDFFYVRRWTAKERLEIDSLITEISTNESEKGLLEMLMWVVITSLCDENGEQTFSDIDKPIIENMDGELLDAIYDAGMIHNKMKEGSVKEEAKN
jgi:hypothetical protein